MESVHDKTEATGEAKSTSQLNILLAEDDKISELLLRHTLKEYYNTLTKVNTGAEAVASVKENPHLDVVLMDIRMPEMDGLEATKKIREFNKKVIIIAQTAYGSAEDREQALEAGCNDHISKPISKQSLMNAFAKFFNQ